MEFPRGGRDFSHSDFLAFLFLPARRLKLAYLTQYECSAFNTLARPGLPLEGQL